jgi:hypothetical protein
MMLLSASRFYAALCSLPQTFLPNQQYSEASAFSRWSLAVTLAANAICA